MRSDRVDLSEDHCHLYPDGGEAKHNSCKMFMEGTVEYFR